MKRFRVSVTIRSLNVENPLFKELNRIADITYLNQTGKRLSSDELISVIKDSDVVIAGTEIFSENVLKSSKNLVLISRVGTGLDSINMPVAIERGITVLNTPESPVPAVAEHTITLILILMKHLDLFITNKKQADYQTGPGHLLYGKNVGLIGLGRIGKRVAGLLDSFGCRVLYYDPYISSDVPVPWIRMNSIEDVIIHSDIISLHTPTQNSGETILNKERLSKSKGGIIVINTARGSLIDNKALYECLLNESVTAAGLDVITEDSYTQRIANHAHVVITPHVASNTVESRDQMETEAIQNIITYIQEKSL